MLEFLLSRCEKTKEKGEKMEEVDHIGSGLRLDG